MSAPAVRTSDAPQAEPLSPAERNQRVDELWRARPRSRLLRVSVAALLALVVVAWSSGKIDLGELLAARRVDNLERFLHHDAVPYPLRETGWQLSTFLDWAGSILSEHGLTAALATFWISVLAMVLAGLAALVLSALGASSLMTRDPYLREPSPGAGRGAWRLASGGARLLFVLLRAIPEYVWAFLLLAILGPSAWPAVLALAIHNAGILGRLGADTIENLDRTPLRALAMLGARRHQLVAWAALPLALPRLLVYLFYRYETCIREATVLGMLGVVSLGYWIQEARARQRYDEMLLLVAVGALLVIVGDVVSHLTRGWLRRER